MARYMLLMNYGGADCAPMTEWTPEEIRAHIAFMHELGDELSTSGELVGSEGLSGPDLAKIVTWDGVGAPVVTDGPFAESKELLAGYWLVDVADEARAIAIAAKTSAAPGPGGTPIRQQIEVRAIMGPPEV